MSSAPESLRSFIKVAPTRYVDDRRDYSDDEFDGDVGTTSEDYHLSTAITSDEYFDPPTPPLPMPLVSTPSYVSRLHRPPPIDLPKVPTATATALTHDTTTDTLTSDRTQAEIIWREERIRSVYAHAAHNASKQITHSFSIVLFVVNQGLSVVEIIFASVWSHQVGLVVGATAFAFGLAGSVLWYRQTFDSEHSFVVFTVRPLYAAIRAAVLAILITLILIHVLHFDPTWTAYPTQCDYAYNCARIGGGNATDVGPLRPFSGEMSVAQVKAAVVDRIHASPLTTLLDAQLYTPAGTNQSVLLIRARVISYWLSIPSDLLIHIQCYKQPRQHSLAVVWMQSQSRLNIADNGENLRRIDDMTAALNDGHLVQRPTECT